MSCTIEKALADARALVERLREHDNAAEALIEQTTALNKRVEAMKQYQEEIQELNEVARHRPRSSLVLGIQQENRQIRELQQENKELRTSLEEHQSALELIMSKYREQMFRLLMASKKDDPGIIMKLKEQHSKFGEKSLSLDVDALLVSSDENGTALLKQGSQPETPFALFCALDTVQIVINFNHKSRDTDCALMCHSWHNLGENYVGEDGNASSKMALSICNRELQVHVDQITEMAAVMRKAIEIDEQQGCKEQERIFQLEQENKGLREILQITRESFLNLKKEDASESTSLSALVTNSDLSLRKS